MTQIRLLSCLITSPSPLYGVSWVPWDLYQLLSHFSRSGNLKPGIASVGVNNCCKNPKAEPEMGGSGSPKSTFST